ncbi:MAG TPA: DUF177 domain-containing protein [Bacteroidetes bacterium]|nr:DUF177 domain-containing protein [Bacteroidota bacterium]
MNYLKRFDIPIKGMNIGIHEYHFEINAEFFENLDNTLIRDGDYKVKLICEKRERMVVLNFEISGQYHAICDRCLAEIDIPTIIDSTVFLKFGENITNTKELDDVIYIDEKDYKYNLAAIINQLIILSMPYKNVYDCENDPNPKCDFKMLERLENEQNAKDSIIESSIWDKLKDIN